MGVETNQSGSSETGPFGPRYVSRRVWGEVNKGVRWGGGETYGSANDSYLAFSCELEDFSAAGGGLLPEISQSFVALEIEVFVLVAEDVVGG